MCELTRLSDDGTPPVDGVPVLGFTIVGVVLVGRVDIILCQRQHVGFMELYALVLMLQHVLQHYEGTLPCQVCGTAH